MKPSPLRVHRPTSVDETLELLTTHGETGKILAGGQSLVPVLNMRLAAPSDLIDITAVEGLDALIVRAGDETAGGAGAAAAGASEIDVSALVTHRRLERSDEVARANPLLREALRFVAHPAIRNRGTTVGSLAHADPNGEMPMILALTGGRVNVLSARGARTICSSDLNVGPLETTLEHDEIITSAVFGALPAGSRTGFDELARRSGDYALAGVGMVLDTDDDSDADTGAADSDGVRSSADAVITGLRLGFVSVTDVPEVLDLGSLVAGVPMTAAAEVVDEVVAQVKDFIDPGGDIHATADYRRHLAGVIASRLFRRLCRTTAAKRG